MKKSLKSLLYFAAATAIAACSQEKLVPENNEPVSGKVVYFGTEVNDLTKASITTEDDATFSAAWENEDAIKVSGFMEGVYMEDFDAKWADGNKCFASTNAAAFFGVECDYIASFPACNAEGTIDFGAERIQDGNKYNGDYDVMLSQTKTMTLEEGKTFIFNMDRQTAIAYFHLTSDYTDEKVVSATLTVNENTLAGSFGFANGVLTPQKESNRITLLFDNAATINNLQLWFNVFPGTYTGLKLEVETEKHTLTIQNSNTVEYKVGKLYKVASNVTSKYILKDGEYAFIAHDYNYIMPYYTEGNNIDAVTYTIDDSGKIVPASDAGYEGADFLYTVKRQTEGTYEGYYTIMDANGNYIYAAGANSNNYLKADILPDAAKFYWSITNYGIVANIEGSEARNQLRYNSSSKLFSCYSSGQSAVEIIPESKLSYNKTPKIKVSATELSLSASGASEVDITVTPNKYCGVISANANVEWLTAKIENGKLVVTSGVNSGAERTGKITLTAEGAEAVNITVTQDGGLSKSGSITITAKNSGVTGSYADKEFTVDGVRFGFSKWMKNNNIQAKSGTTNSLYNTTPFPSPIKKITFKQTGTARAITVYGGTSEKPTEQIKSPSTALEMVFDFTGMGYTYFSMTTPGNAVYFDSIIIEWEEESELTPVSVSGITLDRSTAEMVKGESLTLTAGIQPEDATNKSITWTSSDDKVATVTDGVVKALAAGTATITATTVDGGFTANCEITVTLSAEVFTTIKQIKNALASGTQSAPAVFAAKLDGAVVTYVNGNNAYIEDATAGILYFNSGHGLTAGDVLSGTVEGSGYNYNGTVEITALTTKPTATTGEAPAPKVVTLAQLEADYDAYTSRLVKVEGVTLGTALSSSSRSSSITQDAKTIAVYLQNKSVTLAGGIYGDLTCVPGYYNTDKQLNIWAKEHFEIVQIAVTGISLDQTTLSVEAGRSAVLTATITPVNAANKSITWTSNNEAVATVTNGTVKGVAEGKATITATTVDGGFTATCTVEVTPSPGKTETIDFESDASAYSFWTFENMISKQTGSITAKAGTYYGTTGGKATASITTTSAVVSPLSITFYVSRQSKNTTDSSWKLQVSSDNKTWTDVTTNSATSMSKGTWVEITQDLSAYSNVYVRVSYTGSTAVRNIDALKFTYLE